MQDATDISADVQRAFVLACADPDIQVITPLRATDDGSGDVEFECSVAVVPHPNPEKLPPRANLRVVIANGFPLTGVEIYAKNEDVQGFPHQDAETDKLCLFPERLAPCDVSKLSLHLGWAKEWLSDAAQGMLLKPGDPYELPDFSRRDAAKRLPTNLPLLFVETMATFGNWRDRLGQAGRVELIRSPTLRGLLARSFRADGGQLVIENAFSDQLVDAKRRIYGRWVLLPTLTFFRHRPPQMMTELQALCNNVGINLLANIRWAWEERNTDPQTSFLLAGCPIPRRVGEQPAEVHWQPLYFDNFKTVEAKLKPKYGKSKRGGLWNNMIASGLLMPKGELLWGKSDNISGERLYARGGHAGIAARKKIIIAGCGAVGSVVAELMARGGAADLALFDADLFSLGNQCRHTLDGRDVGKNKAEALAARLQSANPVSIITGFASHIPLPGGRSQVIIEATKAIDAADLLLDCTTDEGAFLWLNGVARRTHARVASVFVNFRATVLTLCVSGRTTPCRRVCRKLYYDIAAGRTPINADEYGAKPSQDDLVLSGAGCWHPTFPAANTHLWALATAAVEALNEVLKAPIRTDGVALLMRRNAELLATPPKPFVETVWCQTYR